MLDGHGDDLHLVEGTIRHNFSSNVYYNGCPKELLDALIQNIRSVQNYPSPAAHELNVLAAKKHELSNNYFLFTNGATEAFYLIAQCYSLKKAAIVAPTFSEYEDACKIFGLTYRLISKAEIEESPEGLIFLCNPNNPDGSVFAADQIEEYLRKKNNTTFVIDEAYIEFTESITSVIGLTSKYDNLIVVRSLTKTFTIPGLRLGYIASQPEIIKQLLSLKMPWTVNTLAIQGGIYLFKNYDKLLFNCAALLEKTAHFQNQLNLIDGIKVCNSHTSYFLIELVNKSAKACKQYLISKHAILVRDATNFNGLSGEYIRLSTQNETANRKLIQALKQWI